MSACSFDHALEPVVATALFWKPQVALLVNEPTLLPVLMPLAPAATLRVGQVVPPRHRYSGHKVSGLMVFLVDEHPPETSPIVDLDTPPEHQRPISHYNGL